MCSDSTHQHFGSIPFHGFTISRFHHSSFHVSHVSHVALSTLLSPCCSLHVALSRCSLHVALSTLLSRVAQGGYGHGQVRCAESRRGAPHRRHGKGLLLNKWFILNKRFIRSVYKYSIVYTPRHTPSPSQHSDIFCIYLMCFQELEWQRRGHWKRVYPSLNPISSQHGIDPTDKANPASLVRERKEREREERERKQPTRCVYTH